MKKIITLLIVIFIGATTQSYSQELAWSVAKKVKSRIIYTNILGAFNNSYYVVRFNKKTKQTFIIERYNRKLSIGNEFEFKLNKKYNVDKIILLDGKVLIFYSIYDRGEKIYNLYCDILNSNLNVIKKRRFVTSTKVKSSNEHLFRIEKDIASKQFLVFYPSEIIGDNIKFGFYVTDVNFAKHYHTKVNIGFANDFKIEDIYLSEKSVGVILSSQFGKLLNKRKQLSFLYYDFEKEKREFVNLFNDSIKFTNVAFKYDLVNKSFTLNGFYSYLKERESIGVAFLNINRLDDRRTFRYIRFSDRIISDIMGRKKTKGNIEDFYPREVTMRNDGGIIFSGEYFDVQKEYYNDYYNFNLSYVKYYYRYSDVFIMSINPDGNVDWFEIIRKDQVTMNDDGYYSSFLIGNSYDKLLVLYNDLEKNKWNLMSNQINPNGKLETKILVNGNQFDGYLIPKIGKQVNSNEILIPGFGKKKGFILLKIRI